MSDQKTNVVAAKPQDGGMTEYVPFGAQDKVKLSVRIVQNLIAVKTKTGASCSDNDALKFIAMCQAKRLNPFEGDAYLIGYDTRDGAKFSLITAHQAFLKRAETHPEFDGMESGCIVRDGEHALQEVQGDFVDEGLELVGGWARVHFKNRKHAMYKRLKLSRYAKGFGVWVDDPAGMIVKCAEADALRSSFPTMLGGLYMREELPVDPTAGLKKPEFASGQPLFSEGTAETGKLISDGGQDDSGKKLEIGGTNYVKAVRNLCKMSSITEGAVLDFLGDTGSTDGSVTTLEELAVYGDGATLKLVHDSWGSISAKIKEVKGGAV